MLLLLFLLLLSFTENTWFEVFFLSFSLFFIKSEECTVGACWLHFLCDKSCLQGETEFSTVPSATGVRKLKSGFSVTKE